MLWEKVPGHVQSVGVAQPVLCIFFANLLLSFDGTVSAVSEESIAM